MRQAQPLTSIIEKLREEFYHFLVVLHTVTSRDLGTGVQRDQKPGNRPDAQKLWCPTHQKLTECMNRLVKVIDVLCALECFQKDVGEIL